METLYTYIATPLDRNFSIAGGVVRSQTKCSSSIAKCVIGLRLECRLALIELFKNIAKFYEFTNMPGFLIDGHMQGFIQRGGTLGPPQNSQCCYCNYL